MYLQLDSLCIHLDTQSSLVADYWRELFGPWITDAEPTHIDARLAIEVADALPPLPDSKPIFEDTFNIVPGFQRGVLEAYRDDGVTILHFYDGSYLRIEPSETTDIPTITGYTLASIFNTERFEDVTMVSLAPVLRGFGYYLVHASGATYANGAILFVGRSGSGKTTTCLNLVLQDWELLSNDVIMLHEREGVIYALPVPDMISMRPRTVTLLPALRELVGDIDKPMVVSSNKLCNGKWADPVPVAAICFPQVEEQDDNELEPYPKALALARLLQESVDCWDEDSLSDHATILTKTSDQAQTFTLRLGTDTTALPTQLKTLCQ